MKRRTPVLAALLLAVSLAVPAVSAAASTDQSHTDSQRHHATVLAFNTMAAVKEPFTGDANPVRGVPGGGLPWDVRTARGRLTDGGRLDVRVRGLVLSRRAPVPPDLQGTNPVPEFRAIVSCLSSANGEPTTVNVSSVTARASVHGDARIRDHLRLPNPCFAPIVFVTSGAGAWFAATGS